MHDTVHQVASLRIWAHAHNQSCAKKFVDIAVLQKCMYIIYYAHTTILMLKCMGLLTILYHIRVRFE